MDSCWDDTLEPEKFFSSSSVEPLMPAVSKLRCDGVQGEGRSAKRPRHDRPGVEGAGGSPTSWVAGLTAAFATIFPQPFSELQEVLIESWCSGLGTPTVGLEALLGSHAWKTRTFF